jgi:hypothetical protein
MIDKEGLPPGGAPARACNRRHDDGVLGAGRSREHAVPHEHRAVSEASGRRRRSVAPACNAPGCFPLRPNLAKLK